MTIIQRLDHIFCRIFHHTWWRMVDWRASEWQCNKCARTHFDRPHKGWEDFQAERITMVNDWRAKGYLKV
jgi:hypothetical protein